MFDLGWSEMMVILVVALIVIGPRDLPRVARNVGRWVAKARAMAREFQNQLEDMARETELDKVKQDIEKAGRTDVKRSIEKTVDPEGELGRAFDTTDKERAPRRASRSSGKSAPAEEPRAETPAAESTDAPEPQDGAKPMDRTEAETEHRRVPAETP